MTTKQQLIDEQVASWWRKYSNGEIVDPETILRQSLTTAYETGERDKHKEIARRLNKVMNRHSKPMSEGGLDYVKAFEAMEKLEYELFKELSHLTPTDNNKV